MEYKADWAKAQARFRAWWAGEALDRPVLQVTAPRTGKTQADSPWYNWNLAHNLYAPEKALADFERHCQVTFFGGEAFPNFWLNLGPGVMASYIGATPQVRQDTVWFETPLSWDEALARAHYAPDAEWWRITRHAAATAVAWGAGKFFVGMTDIGGNLDVLSSLRGAQTLVYDLFDHPHRVKALMARINLLWFRYYTELHTILQTRMQGTSAWMGLWCPRRWYPLQCDFSALLTPKLFAEFVAPWLAEQATWLDHAIYHWDGPGQVQHLDLLLDLPGLDGIQWTPGAGHPTTGKPDWFPLYRRILERGKRLVLLGMEPQDVERVLTEFPARGLLISTTCDTQAEAEDLLKQAPKWTRAGAHRR